MLDLVLILLKLWRFDFQDCQKSMVTDLASRVPKWLQSSTNGVAARTGQGPLRCQQAILKPIHLQSYRYIILQLEDSQS